MSKNTSFCAVSLWNFEGMALRRAPPQLNDGFQAISFFIMTMTVLVNLRVLPG
jgi:hypothetical protein